MFGLDGRRCSLGRVTSITDTRRATQFCTFNPAMRRNSRSLLVTIVRPAALACAAIHKSLLPIGCPWDSSDARIIHMYSQQSLVSAEREQRS